MLLPESVQAFVPEVKVILTPPLPIMPIACTYKLSYLYALKFSEEAFKMFNYLRSMNKNAYLDVMDLPLMPP